MIPPNDCLLETLGQRTLFRRHRLDGYELIANWSVRRCTETLAWLLRQADVLARLRLLQSGILLGTAKPVVGQEDEWLLSTPFVQALVAAIHAECAAATQEYPHC